tara:strand:- start:167 stop:316 length:150 start_codon:yes stop_codon:yes gene_type:complete
MAYGMKKRKKKMFMGGGMVGKKNKDGKFMYGMGGKVISSTRYGKGKKCK